MNFKKLFFWIFLIPSLLYADQNPMKLGGDFIVKSIKRNAYNDYSITFKPDYKSDRVKLLVLNTDHVHGRLEQGSRLRLSAEVVSIKDKIAKVSQIVVYYPSNQGTTPVWMISKSRPSNRVFSAGKLIEVHSPQSDYLVF